MLSLVVDNDGFNFEGKEHAKHLVATLGMHYKVTINWEGKKYVGIDIGIDKKKQTAIILMISYV